MTVFEEIWVLKIAFELGWKGLIIEEDSGERIIFGIHPQTGLREPVPSLGEFERSQLKRSVTGVLGRCGKSAT